jgi:hypothetical protein
MIRGPRHSRPQRKLSLGTKLLTLENHILGGVKGACLVDSSQ